MGSKLDILLMMSYKILNDNLILERHHPVGKIEIDLSDV